jgi:succinoglycan biosynthesis transport protein ExoP
MEPEVKTFDDYLAILRRRKALLVTTSLVIFVISASFAFGLPPIYRSAATILIEQQSVPTDLVRSTVTSYADEQIEVISQRAMSTENLLEIIGKYGLYADELKRETTKAIITRMREEDIQRDVLSADVVDPRSGRPTTATIAFTISYDNKSPELAQKVANELTSLYLRENLRSRAERAADTSNFLAAEAQRMSKDIALLEAKLAAFKERNVGQLPELVELNLQLMDRTERELAGVDQQVRSLEERKIYLKSELAQLSPVGGMYSETGARILAPADRLRLLQTEYTRLSAVYAPDHPDLVKMRKEIAALKGGVGDVEHAGETAAQLEALRAELRAARERYTADHPDVKRLERSIANLEKALAAGRSAPRKRAAPVEPDNPAYIQLQAQLQAAESDLRTLGDKRDELTKRIAAYELRLTQTPQVERQYRALSRDYENAVAKYQEIKAKEMEAELAQSLETERKGERFTLIEPPLLPEEPVSPNRLAILFLGVVLSFVGGLGAVATAEAADDSVRGSKGVTAVTGVPPLAAIPYIETRHERQQRLWRRASAAAVLVLGVVLAVAFVHWYIRPLDVAWFVALRRLGI